MLTEREEKIKLMKQLFTDESNDSLVGCLKFLDEKSLI